jgi:hypothetical protein
MSITDIVTSITRDVDFASQLTSIVTEQNLNADQARKVFSTLNPDNIERELPYLRALEEVSKYEGFNPREIVRLLVMKHEDYAKRIAGDPASVESVQGEVSLNGEQIDFSFTSNQPFNKDMQFICLMFITRGAAHDKILKKSSNHMKQCMNIMKIKYGINVTVRAPGRPLDSKTITIPRIAASFPSITIGLFHRGFGRTIYDPLTLFPGAVLPRALFSPMIPSMLPKTADAPIAIALCIAVKVDEILHQVGQKTDLTALYQYLMASYNSTATTEMLKIKYSVSWGLGTKENGVFSYIEAITSLRDTAKMLIRTLRGTDPNLQHILSLV